MKALLTSIIFLVTVISQAQWQPDVRLTNNSADSWTSYNNAWCIAASGSAVHVVWYDFRDGNYEIYYKRSTDAGENWGVDTRLTNNSATSELPSVSVFGQVVHIAWEEHRDGNREIYYKRSTDGGISWGADVRLTNNSAVSRQPSVAVSGSTVHVVWEDLRDGNREMYYKRSTNGGTTWGADVRLTNNSAQSGGPCVSVLDSTVHFVWDDVRDGDWEVYYKRSTNGGTSWTPDARLTNSSGDSWSPSVSVSGDVVHVVWRDLRDGNWEIYYKRSTDGGVNWGADARLTNNSATSEFPCVSVSDSTVHVVWHDNRDGNWEIYYKRSTDGGVSWGTDTRLTNSSAESDYSFVSVSGKVVHVVWQDNRDGNYEIYYKRDTCGSFSTPTITPSGPTTFCNGGSVILTSSSASSYMWSTGATTQAITVTTSGMYDVTVTDVNGCMGSASEVTVTVNPNPTPSITPNGPTTFCDGGSVVLTSSSASAYFWSNGAHTQSITVAVSGTFNVTVVDSKGCVGSSPSVSVSVNSNPTTVITPNGPTTFCDGGSVMLTSSSASSYAWSNGAATQTITVTATGGYNVTVIDGNGCVGTATPVTVTVNPNPTPTVTPNGPTTFCAGGSVTLTSSPASSYAWSNGATTQALSVSTSGTYTVTVTDANGCSGSGTPTIVVVNPNPSPMITPNGPTTFCAGDSVVLAASTASSYAWSHGATVQAVTVGVGGVYDVTVTDANGCVGIATPVIVTVNPNPAPTITPNGPITFCLGDSVTLTSSSASSYAWSTGASTQAITVVTSGTYNVTVTDGNGCTGSATPVVVIAANPTPIVTPGGPTTFCQGGSVMLTASTTTSYLWSNAATTQSITVTTSGVYNVTVTDAIGCVGSATPVTVTVHPNPTPTITPNGPTTFCDGGSVTLMASAATSYLWNNASTTQSILVTTSGSYIVTVTDANGCVGNSAAMAVQVNANPSPTVTPNGPTIFCDGGSVILTSAAANAYLWSNGSTNSSITVTTSGSYSVTVTDANACLGSASPVTVAVNSNPTPTITPGGPTTFCDGESVMLSVPANTSYLWSNGDTGQTTTATTSGSYNVTVTDTNGCEGSASPVSVTVHANPPVPLIHQQGLLLICSVSGMSDYEWYHNSNLLATCNTDTCQCVGVGDYHVVITDVNVCSSSSGTFTASSCPTGVAVPGVGPALHLHPNPNSGRFMIKLSQINSDHVNVNVTNMLGETVFLTEVTGSHTVLVDLGDVPSGFYVIHVEADGVHVMEKVIVE